MHFQEQSNIFLIHYSSYNNHMVTFSDSFYVWAIYTTKIMVWGANARIIHPLKSLKIVNKFQEFLNA